MKQRKINPEAIKALKRVMPYRKTRQMFIDECIKAKCQDFESEWPDNISLATLFISWVSFEWSKSKNGHYFWQKIFNKLTEKEYKLKIFLP